MFPVRVSFLTGVLGLDYGQTEIWKVSSSKESVYFRRGEGRGVNSRFFSFVVVKCPCVTEVWIMSPPSPLEWDRVRWALLGNYTGLGVQNYVRFVECKFDVLRRKVGIIFTIVSVSVKLPEMGFCPVPWSHSNHSDTKKGQKWRGRQM